MDREERKFIADALLEKIREVWNGVGSYTDDDVKDTVCDKVREFVSAVNAETGENTAQLVSIESDRKAYPEFHVSISLGGDDAMQIKNKRNKLYVLYYYRFSQKLCLFEHIAPVLMQFFRDYHDIRERYKAVLFEKNKAEKEIQIARTSIEEVIKAGMKDSGRKWRLVFQKERALLQVKTEKGKIAEISLGYKTFIRKFSDIEDVLKKTEEFISDLPFVPDLKNCSPSDDDWQQ